MSFNELVADVLTNYAVAWQGSDGAECFGIAMELFNLIEQHVAEAVKAEREAIEKIAGDEVKSLLDTAGMLYSRQEFVGYERHSAQAQALMKLQEAIRERGAT